MATRPRKPGTRTRRTIVRAKSPAASRTKKTVIRTKKPAAQTKKPVASRPAASRPAASRPAASRPARAKPSAAKRPARRTAAAAKPKTPTPRPKPARRAASVIRRIPRGRPSVGKVRPGVLKPLVQDSVGNLFETRRAGDAVVRPEDLLALRIERRGLSVIPGAPPRLVKSGRGVAYLILHFPPQAITEQTFFEAAPPGTQNPSDHPHPENQPKPDPAGGSEAVGARPIRARIANESRVVFRVPNGFDIPYTLPDIRDACQTMALRVAPNAPKKTGWTLAIAVDKLFNKRVIKTLKPKRRAALSSFAMRSIKIGAVQDDSATHNLRQASAAPALKPSVTGAIGVKPKPGLLAKPAVPAAPGATTTAIEMPWRLILSPHSGERWHHANTPATSEATQRTELWHSRLVAPDGKGNVIQPPYTDPNRTVRAIWAKSGEGSTKSMKGAWPGPTDIPPPSTAPFRMPLDDYDRFQFTHLSSNFSVKSYTPEPISANLMMLTSLGGWLDSRGAWEPPGLAVEEWVHRASMARDHYVRVVYRGFLFPFGHRVSLVKVSERKFHNGTSTQEQVPGNTAYLRQRLFIVIREPERKFDSPVYTGLTNAVGNVAYSRQLPFSSIRILTKVTPNLDRPDVTPSSVFGLKQQMFWPHVNGLPFRFDCVGTDLDGRRVAFDLPMIFMDNMIACPRQYNQSTKKLMPAFGLAEINAGKAKTAFDSAQDKHDAFLNLQSVALAASGKAGDTAVKVETMTFSAEVEPGNQKLRNASDDLSRPVFFPKVVETRARVGAMTHLTGSSKGNLLQWNSHYLQHGFAANVGEVFVDVVTESDMAQFDFSAQGDRSGGFIQPNIKPKALSRLSGPVMGDVAQYIAGTVPAGSGFPKTEDLPSIGDLPLPLLFGCIPLGDIIEAVTNLGDSPERVPKFESEAGTQVESFINGLVHLYGFITDIASQPGGIARAGMLAFKATLNDIDQQTAALNPAQAAPLKLAIT
jgi:hypothetical protein